MVRLLLLLFFTISWVNLSAQADSARFDADFRFVEGIYFSHASLLANQPDLGWEAIDGEMVQLPEDFKVQIADYGYKDVRINQDIIPYAISLDGKPYFFVRHDQQRQFHEFTGLRVHGLLSTLQYDTTIQTRQLMKAYNPANGLPFRQAWVEREKTLRLYRILHLRSGARLPFTKENILELCADDEDLTEALMKQEKTEETLLLRAVRLYDDRHFITLPLR